MLNRTTIPSRHTQYEGTVSSGMDRSCANVESVKPLSKTIMSANGRGDLFWPMHVVDTATQHPEA